MTTSMKTRDETGGTLILALVYIIIVGMVVGALGGWIANDLNNSGRFSAAGSEQSAARSVTEVAMQSIRYTPLIGTGLSQTVEFDAVESELLLGIELAVAAQRDQRLRHVGVVFDRLQSDEHRHARGDLLGVPQ